MGRSAHGLVYIFGKRAYSYKLSRFLTPDPARSEYSSYLYAKSNPLKFHDKSGEIAVAIVAFFTALIGTSAISASLAGGAGGATAGAVTASATAAGRGRHYHRCSNRGFSCRRNRGHGIRRLGCHGYWG